MSANKNALLEPDLPANKYAQLEAILAATDFPVKKRLNRKQFKEQIDAAKKSYAVYLSSAVKEPEKITYVEFLETKKKTTALVDSQKANVVINEPLIAPTPEMRTTLLNEISRSILQEFDVAAARSLSTVQNSSLYHSKAQMDSQDAALQTNVLRLYNIIRVALGDFYLTRHTSKNRKRARAVFDETLSEPDVAVDSVFKIMDAEMPKLGVVLIPNSQQMNGFYDAGFITWKAMQKHLVKSEGFDAADLVEVDPRITAAVKLKSYIPSDTAQSVIE